MAKDDRGVGHLRPAGLVRQELAAEDRPHAEHLEEVLGHDHSTERFTAFAQDEKVARPAVERGWFERAARRAPVDPLADGDALRVGSAIDTRRRKKDEPIGFGVGWWRQ